MRRRYFDIAVFSEKGIRSTNQDTVFAADNGSAAVFLVSDGIGGHDYGERASAAIRDAVIERWTNIKRCGEEIDIDRMTEQYKDDLIRVNTELFDKYAKEGLTVGATVILLAVCGSFYRILSLGDSHIYKLETDRMNTLTEDDVWENLPETRAELTEDEILRDERHGKLTAAIGPYMEIQLKSQIGLIEKGDEFVLCSDGVYKFCASESLFQIMSKRKNAAWKLKKIKKCVEKNKTKDNYSAIVCRCLL